VADAARAVREWSRFSPSAIVAMDDEGRIVAMNAPAEALLSTTIAETTGRPYTDVFGPSLADRLVPLFLRVSRTGSAREPQLVEATLPGGRRASLRANAGPLLDADDKFVGIIFAADDRSEAVTATRAAEEHAGKERHLRNALNRYVGSDLASVIDARPSFLDLGGRRQIVSVLHADVRGYSTVAEQLEPERVMALLLKYHGAAVQALRDEGATVDRFIGDAVLALWNAPSAQAEHARLAVRGGLALLAAASRVGSELRYGVGVHTGPAVVGNLGSDQLMAYTAIGDTVNIAARLQSGAGAGELVCSESTLAAAGSGIRSTALGALAVKGRSATVDAHRVTGIDA
jgi:PAS domain S-box-containing protein